MKLHIRMEDISGNVKDAYYDTFRIEDEVCSTNISTLSSCEVNEHFWHYRLWSFETRDTKLEMFLNKNQHTQRKLLNFEN